MLCAGARIEAHDEVVAVVMRRLQFLRWLGKEESAPVRDAAHNAILLENDSAGSFGDSKGQKSV